MCQSFSNVVSYEIVACSRRSDSRAREKNSRGKPKRKKKNEGRLEGERGRERVLSLSLPPFPPSSRPRPRPRFPGVQLNSLPTYRHALLSEHLEQANEIDNIFSSILLCSIAKKKNIEMLKTTVSRTRHFLARQE